MREYIFDREAEGVDGITNTSNITSTVIKQSYHCIQIIIIQIRVKLVVYIGEVKLEN